MQTQNKVELIGYYGNDTLHALSAWTSTSRDLTDEKRDRVGKLLKMLGEGEHETPFEKSMLHFLVDVETASHIHIIKHRIGVSVNGESARYKELKADKFHIPRDWPSEEQERLTQWCYKAFEEYHGCLARLLAGGMDRKRAKESARFYLPYANSLTLDVSFNFRSFMHFQGLRNSGHEQLEIREIAQTMLQLVRDTGAFPLSLEAFGYDR
jgi:flavin-dependent thymidylate synthase